jgi:hypothetical protein
MRTKTVELDGAKWTIAPLTMREIETWTEKQKEAFQIPEGAARERQVIQLWREFLCYGLNNVHRLEWGKWPEPKPQMIEPDEIPDIFDLHAFEVLRDELLVFSRLKTVDASKNPAPAESASPAPSARASNA